MATLCAIRWDAFYSNLRAEPAWQTARGLGDPDLQWRAPFFATPVGTGCLRYDYTTATMTQEIQAAVAGKVNCWVFLRYVTGSSMDAGLQLYKANPNKNLVKWASMHSVNTFGGPTTASTTTINLLVAEMTESHYMTVGANRPLLFLYYAASEITGYGWGTLANFKTNCLDILRTRVIATGRGDPYIVWLGGGATSSAATMVTAGANASSNYISDINSTTSSYALQDTTTQAFWAAQLATGVEMLPIAMCGWSRIARIRRPVSWEFSTQGAYVGHARSILPTNSELANHMLAAKTFTITNAAQCPYGLILAYAWNEHDEGGWLCPTISDPPTVSQPGGARLAAIAAAI